MNDDVLLVDAVRTPIGRRNGAFATVHPVDLLGTPLGGLFDRTGIDPAEVGQVVGGCVTQVGEQAFNIARTAWLAAGLPMEVSATTVDAQCGSSQQAASLAIGLVAGGITDAAVACGVESMSRVPMGTSLDQALGFGFPITESYRDRYEWALQFECAEALAQKWGITREDADELGLRSQTLAAEAWDQDRFATQIVDVTVDTQDGPGATEVVHRDGALRSTTKEALGELRPILPDGGVHTAGSASQIADGASAVLFMNATKAATLDVDPLARVVDTCLVGVDPETMLTGPIDATRLLLERNSLSIHDIDFIEINEAFASVVLAWARDLQPDFDRVNPNGGAIAMGHPLGASGTLLLTKAAHELRRTGGRRALVTMCCGGGLGTGTLIERI